MVAIVLGAAGLLAASAWQPAHADAPKPVAKASKAPKKATKPAKATPATPATGAASDHCAIDDLGFDSMLAKKSDTPTAPAPKKTDVDTIAKSKAAADKWDLGRKSRDASRPTDGNEVKMQAKTLSQSAVAAVVTDKQSDLEYCLENIPEADRGSEQFTLHLSITAKGTVLSSAVTGGDNAEKIDACVQEQVKRWTFPQADAPTEVDYALSFHVEHIGN
jgi:hypothetical protein